MKKIMVFPRSGELEKAKAKLNNLNLQYSIIEPPKNYDSLCVSAVVFEQEVYAALMSDSNNDFVFSGCIDYTKPKIAISDSPEDFSEDIFGRAYIMHIAPCVADENRMRLTVHLSNDLSHIFPYINTYMPSAFYNADAQVITFMEGYRLISVYNSKIAIAKADEITDSWRLLNKIRTLVNTVNKLKHTITPSYHTPKKPPALDILKRLPGISCGECGYKTCMAFALSLWGGNAEPTQCTPIFHGDYINIQEPFLEICSALGFGAGQSFTNI